MTDEVAVMLLHHKIGRFVIQRDEVSVILLELDGKQGTELGDGVGRRLIRSGGHAHGGP